MSSRENNAYTNNNGAASNLAGSDGHDSDDDKVVLTKRDLRQLMSDACEKGAKRAKHEFKTEFKTVFKTETKRLQRQIDDNRKDLNENKYIAGTALTNSIAAKENATAAMVAATATDGTIDQLIDIIEEVSDGAKAAMANHLTNHHGNGADEDSSEDEDDSSDDGDDGDEGSRNSTNRTVLEIRARFRANALNSPSQPRTKQTARKFQRHRSGHGVAALLRAGSESDGSNGGPNMAVVPAPVTANGKNDSAIVPDLAASNGGTNSAVIPASSAVAAAADGADDMPRLLCAAVPSVITVARPPAGANENVADEQNNHAADDEGDDEEYDLD